MCAHRKLLADYFDQQNIQYAFFSAANAVAIQQARREARRQEEDTEAALSPEVESDADAEEDEDQPELDSESPGHSITPPRSPSAPDPSDGEGSENEDGDDTDDVSILVDEGDEAAQDPRIRVLSVLELEALFIHAAPDLSSTLISLSIPQNLTSICSIYRRLWNGSSKTCSRFGRLS